MMEEKAALDKRKNKEVKDLHKQKLKAKDKGDLIEAAKICNCIGEILSENHCFEDAIKEHTEEIYFSEACSDTIGVAVGHRKVGECLCELGRFEEAIEYQQKHLKIAKSVSNYLEQQRALATIGRTYFVQAERLAEDDGIKSCLLKSQEAYLKSLDICSNKLDAEVSEKEILEMKARLYLNLGLIYEHKLNYNEAMRFVSKALVISKEQNLQDNVFRCHLTLFGLYLNNDLEKALQCSKAALMIAQKQNNKVNEMESLSQMGLALLRLGDFVAALNTLKRVYKYTSPTGVDPIVVANLKRAMKFIKYTTKYEKCEDKNELLLICDKLGDLYCYIGSPQTALDFYLRQLQIAEALNLHGKSLGPIYVSIAVTYSECKEFEKALEYYQKELNVKHGELAEKSSSYCAIANCLENLDYPFQEIKDCYMKALECSQGSGNHVAELKAYCDWSAYLNSFGDIEECENVQSKIKHIRREFDIETIEEESQDPEDNSNSETFSDGELVMLESEDEDIEEIQVSRNNRKTNIQNKKVNKVNERGETPLHCAAISGNIDKTRMLLQQGASVRSRDYCGWTPLHEACNHGHADIVELLIQHQADVNDPGGQHCGKITPLHDASQNGHIKVVKLLVENGASICAKTKDGFTPLELVQESIKADEEEFCKNSGETHVAQRKEVERYLLNALKQGNRKFIPEKSGNRNDKLFGDLLSDSEDEVDSYKLPVKKKKPNSFWEGIRENIENIKPVDTNERPLLDSRNTSDGISSYSSPESDDGHKGFHALQNSLRSIQPKSIVEIQNDVRSVKKNPASIRGDSIDVDFRKTSVCTSLVSESDVPVKDFIVDDMGTKRKRQSKIKYKEVDCVQGQTIPSSVGISKVKKKRVSLKPLKQKRIEGYAGIEIAASDSGDSNPPEISIYQESSHCDLQMINQQSNKFRVKIKINQQIFLVSIPNDNEATIEWLHNEAKQRYQNFCGISTKLWLKTRDGALLNHSDIVTDVIMNNEELIGEVIGLDFPPVIERYKTTCKEIDVKPIPGIEEQFSLNQNFSDLFLRDLFLLKPELEAVFQSISCSMCLSAIDISRTFLGDCNFGIVVHALSTLPSISSLKFSCCGITTKGLQDFAHMLSDGIKEEFKLIMKEPPLFHLNKLYLDNNDFDNLSQFIISMGKILLHCKHLAEVNLESCHLGGSIFDSQSQFRLALKSSSVSSLNLCNNIMGGSDLFNNIFNAVPDSIRCLDLSGTLASHNEHFVLKDVWKSLGSLHLGLKELKLDSFPDCSNDISQSNVTLERLSLRYQKCNFDSLNAICKCIEMINLSYLDLSFSINLNNDLFEVILENLKTNSSLKNLILHSCAIKSPLPENIFTHLGLLSRDGLHNLDLSYNEIEAQDKSKLFNVWNTVHRSYALHELDLWKCLLSIR